MYWWLWRTHQRRRQSQLERTPTTMRPVQLRPRPSARRSRAGQWSMRTCSCRLDLSMARPQDLLVNSDERAMTMSSHRPLRRGNSASYSSYKLIKNSQSTLMPSSNRTIIDQPLLLPNEDQSQPPLEQMQAKMNDLNLSNHQTSLIDSSSSMAAINKANIGNKPPGMMYPYDSSDNGYHSASQGGHPFHHGPNFIEASSTTSSTSSTTPPSSLSSASGLALGSGSVQPVNSANDLK